MKNIAEVFRVLDKDNVSSLWELCCFWKTIAGLPLEASGEIHQRLLSYFVNWNSLSHVAIQAVSLWLLNGRGGGGNVQERLRNGYVSLLTWNLTFSCPNKLGILQGLYPWIKSNSVQHRQNHAFNREWASVDRHYLPPFVINILSTEGVRPFHTMRELCATGN